MSTAQHTLFGANTLPPVIDEQDSVKIQRSGTFIDNMKLPVHRWFRYSAGFSADWVKQVIQTYRPGSILDPFSGSGTVNIVADEEGITSYGYEAHSFVYRLASAKTKWTYSVDAFVKASTELLEDSKKYCADDEYLQNKLLAKCYAAENLTELLQLKSAWLGYSKQCDATLSELLFLAITSILRSTSFAGTAQWQYILPEKKKARVVSPTQAFWAQTMMMAEDMIFMQKRQAQSLARLFNADSRDFTDIADNSVDLVITSPPYANNYDYADATRLEMTFWGEVSSWGDLHDTVRKHLICSSSQHASKERYDLSDLLGSEYLQPVRAEISSVCHELAEVRETKGGKKHYHTMIAAYFNDMSQIFKALRSVVKPKGTMLFVIGDSAPYGVYVPVERWLGELSVAAGFKTWSFEKLRDRNIKWKNRKHRVPLHEGILIIGG